MTDVFVLGHVTVIKAASADARRLAGGLPARAR